MKIHYFWRQREGREAVNEGARDQLCRCFMAEAQRTMKIPIQRVAR